MSWLMKGAEGFCFGFGFALAWRILGAVIAFVAGAHAAPLGG